MRCPECEKLNQESRTLVRSTTKTLGYSFPFFDSDRKEHMHDTNIVTTMYGCSLGHNWNTRGITPCWCGWPQNLESKEYGKLLKGQRA